MPSEELPVPGVGRARWMLELMRVKAGECAEFEVEACDLSGRIAIPTSAGTWSTGGNRSAHAS